MSAEPVAPIIRRKRHEMVADALAAAKLKQAMRPATAVARPARVHPSVRGARHVNAVMSATPVSATPVSATPMSATPMSATPTPAQ